MGIEATLDEAKIEPRAEPKPDNVKVVKIGKDDKKVPDWAAKGLAAAKDWAPGKDVTQEEYEQATQEFLDGPLYQEK